MRRLFSFLFLISFLSTSFVFAQDLPCLRCHTQANPLPEKIKRSGAKTPAELVDFLRNKSPKQALHRAVTDNDIKRAFEQFGK